MSKLEDKAEIDKILLLVWELEKSLTKYDEENGYTSNSKVYYKKTQKNKLESSLNGH